MSVLDLKAQCRGAKYVEETIKLLPETPDPVLLERIFTKIVGIGRNGGGNEPEIQRSPFFEDSPEQSAPCENANAMGPIGRARRLALRFGDQKARGSHWAASSAPSCSVPYRPLGNFS